MIKSKGKKYFILKPCTFYLRVQTFGIAQNTTNKGNNDIVGERIFGRLVAALFALWFMGPDR